MTSAMHRTGEIAEKQPASQSSWAKFAGAALVLANCALLLVHSGRVSKTAALLPLLGFILCSKWRVKGFVASLAFLLSSLYLNGAKDFWMMGYYCSLALSWFICAYAENAIPEVAPLAKPVEKLPEKLPMVIERDVEKERLQERLASLEKTLSTYEMQFKQLVQEHERSLSVAEKKQAEYEFQLEKHLQESEQHLHAQALEIAQLTEQLQALRQAPPIPAEELETEISLLTEEEANLKQLQIIHRNLREQFEEKSAALRQTRKELFVMETALLTAQKELEEKRCEPDDGDLLVTRFFANLERDQEVLEQENQQLQEIISHLSAQKKTARPKKTKKKEKEPIPELSESHTHQE